MYCVYKHTSPTGKVYIGITSRSVEKRWGNGTGYQGNRHFYSAIQKYGWKNFTHEIIACELTKKEACEMEIEFIAKYNSTDPRFGYNISTGGEHGSMGVPCSEEHKEKIRQSRLGERHWFYGKSLSAEHRQKISMTAKGRAKSEAERQKSKEIATELRGKPIMCVETHKVYPSTAEAARLTNSNRTGIVHVLHGKRKTYKGQHWIYAPKELVEAINKVEIKR